MSSEDKRILQKIEDDIFNDLNDYFDELSFGESNQLFDFGFCYSLGNINEFEIIETQTVNNISKFKLIIKGDIIVSTSFNYDNYSDKMRQFKINAEIKFNKNNLKLIDAKYKNLIFIQKEKSVPF